MVTGIQFDEQSAIPIYRQLADGIAERIRTGALVDGERLPPTRELAGRLGLNRTTVSAAYEVLESEGLIKGHVGRGSYVHYKTTAPTEPSGTISFASSRPAEDEFPVAAFQATCREAISGPSAHAILQLGSPSGFAPLRQYLLDEARAEGVVGPGDDILITSGCQQALDLVQRVLAPAGTTVAIEDPVYHGQRNVFVRSDVRLAPIAVGDAGVDVDRIGRVFAQERPKLAVLTPNFQNPTGTTMPLAARESVAGLAAEFQVSIVENDIYGGLRYTGEPLPTVKRLGGTMLIRSFSKIAFPGLRVGWIIAPKPMIASLTAARQWCDLHTDQLSQAVLLRFAESGRLAEHVARTREMGRERLTAALAACEKYLPEGSSFTKPEGGMSVWVRLPEPLDASELLPRAQREGVTYLPGKHFAVGPHEAGTLRLSFGGLSPSLIEAGIARLGRLFEQEWQQSRNGASQFEPISALV
ncbi:MAG TPA: PLP-dependent aminotransferase family protein [Bryobacteraceae bacterium]|nr:PLP-dependent aminotransferase family protein [Bryobacteraceae bacterium]